MDLWQMMMLFNLVQQVLGGPNPTLTPTPTHNPNPEPEPIPTPNQGPAH